MQAALGRRPRELAGVAEMHARRLKTRLGKQATARMAIPHLLRS